MKMNNKGSALFFGLIVISVLAILSVGFIAMVVTEARNTERFIAGINAIDVAEAGLEYGIWEILHNSANYDPLEGWVLDSAVSPVTQSKQDFLSDSAGNQIGEYEVTISKPSSEIFTIVAVAGIPNLTVPESIQRTVQVSLVGEPLFEKAITGFNDINLSVGVFIDSYDDDLGAYGGANRSDQGHICTDSIADDAIHIRNFVLVKGDVVVGVGGIPADVIKYNVFGQITGTERVATEPTPSPSIQAPTGLPDRGTLTVAWGQTKTISSSGEYDNIEVKWGATLNITADATIYVKNDFNVKHLSAVKVLNDADVDIIVGKTFEVAAGCLIKNSSGDAANLAVFGLDSATSINIIGLCSVEGTFYAPNASFNSGGLVSIFGAVTAQHVNVGELALFHFDESLMRRPAVPSTGRSKAIDWHTK